MALDIETTNFQNGISSKGQPIPPTPDTSTATAYTFALSDNGLWKKLNNGSAIAATIPPNSSVAFPVGAILTVQQYGAGVVTWTAGAGVTINSAGALVATNGQYAVSQAYQSAANIWELFGSLA